jgi:choline kinase
MKAIILAAGRGMRLNSDKRSAIPKSMEDINGISIIQYQIKNCLKQGINRFVIVVGYEKEVLIKHILEVLSDTQVLFIENEIYDKTNTLYSLFLAREQMNEDFLYFNADVLFHPLLLEKLVKGENKSLLLVEQKKTGEEEVKVKTENSLIKEIHKQINPKEAEGEFIGIAKFVNKDNPLFIKSLSYGVENKQENNYFEFAVNMMCDETELIAVYTEGLPCIEIDFPEDLKRAKEDLFKNILDYN